MKKEEPSSPENQNKVEEYFRDRGSSADFYARHHDLYDRNPGSGSSKELFDSQEDDFNSSESDGQSFFGNPVWGQSERDPDNVSVSRGNERTYSRRNKRFSSRDEETHYDVEHDGEVYPKDEPAVFTHSTDVYVKGRSSEDEYAEDAYNEDEYAEDEYGEDKYDEDEYAEDEHGVDEYSEKIHPRGIYGKEGYADDSQEPYVKAQRKVPHSQGRTSNGNKEANDLYYNDGEANYFTATAAKQKSEQRKQISATNVFLYLIGSFIWWDLWFRLFVHKSIDFSGVFINLFFSLSLAFTITFIITLLPKRWWRRLLAVPLIVTLIFFGAQFVYHAFFRTLFTWFSMIHGAQVAEFAGDVVLKILANIPILLLAFVPLIIFFAKNPIVNFLKDRKIIPEHWLVEGESPEVDTFFKHDRILKRLFLVTGALVTFTFALLFVNVGENSVNSPYDLYYETNDPLVASGKLGLITAMRVDLRHFLFPKEVDIPTEDTLPEDILIKETTSGSQEGIDTDSSDSTEDPSVTVNPEPTVAPQKEHAFPIDFATISESESNDSLRNMALYFNDIKPSKSNDQTGIFKGYNLIFITAESHSAYSADPDVTPTLWNMQENGIKFKNFYNPVWGVSTSDGEYTGITGLAPKPGIWSLSKSAENNMALTPGNMLRRLGYTTSAWHNHTYTYYGRDVSHPNLGYDSYKGLGNGLEVKKTWPESDLEMMELSYDEFTNTEPFHAYFMTVSGHMNYTFRGNAMATKNRDYVRDLPYNEGGRAYMATQIEFDKALEYLLQRLREDGLADRTLIVINADHYPYGLEKEDYDQLAGKTLEENFEIYRNSLIMYVDGMEPMEVDKVCFTLDILPTIYNLMDIPYDSRLLMGSDVFSEREPLAFFVNRSWITEEGRYNAVTKKFTPAEGSSLEDQDAYIERITQIVRNKLKFSTQVLDYDYYERILPDSIWDIVNEDSGYPPSRE